MDQYTDMNMMDRMDHMDMDMTDRRKRVQSRPSSLRRVKSVVFDL